MINCQQSLNISKYSELYNLIIPEENLLRQIKELVDFSFIYEELLCNYSLDQGRSAIDPILMFKYLFLKSYKELSDVDLVEQSRFDMSFKYFLDLAPEETNLINPSSLTKFRKLRLKDINLLDRLIQKTIEIAISQGIEMSKTIIVDATHTKARYNQKSAEEVLLKRAKNLRKEVYGIDEMMKDNFPTKVNNGTLEEVIDYCQKIVEEVENRPDLCVYDKVHQRMNYLKEAIEDDLEALALSKDEDARIGHKSQEDVFFGYKTHLAMTEDRLISAAVITTGEKTDGKELQTLIEKSEASGIEVEEVIGDTAYSGKDNLLYAKKKEIKLIAKLNPIISQGPRKEEDNFEFNKDANMFICPVGHLATRKARTGAKKNGKNQSLTYYFDIEKCKICPKREGCYKEGAKSKTYSMTIKSDVHKEQLAFEQSDYFKARARQRYMIEAKNSELKNQHGHDVAKSSGLINMQLQSAMTIFVVNIKRILKLKGVK